MNNEKFSVADIFENSDPVLWVDALYEKVCMDGRITSIAVIVLRRG